MIDVLMATYNGEKYLKEQLDSVFNQKVTVPFRVLVSDDGSTDGTLDILKTYGDRITLVKNKGPKGAKGNFMSLISQCNASYAALCDQDDIWEEDKLQKAYDAIAKENKNIPCLVHTDLTVIDAQGQVVRPSLFAHQGWDQKAVTLNRLLVQNNATGCTMLLNRPLMDLVNLAQAETVYMHDWWIALTAAAFGKVICLGDKTVRYRQHEVNVIGASSQTLIGRAIGAFAIGKKLRGRIKLTYTQAKALLNGYGEQMPKEKSACLRFYIQIEEGNKLSRLQNINRGVYTMQNKVQRIGHMLFL